MDYHNTLCISHILYVYIDFIIKVFLGYISCACIIDVRCLQRFWQNMSILRGPNLRNQVAFFAQAPRKLRASKKVHPVGSEERDPMFHRLIIPTKILDKEGSQNIAREICPHNGGEKTDNALQ